MNISFKTGMGMTLAAASSVLAQNPIVTEAEIFLSGKFVAPYTTLSITVIDRVTGQFRHGRFDPAGMIWGAGISSGMEHVTDAAVMLDRSTVTSGAHPDTGGDMVIAISELSQRATRIRPNTISPTPVSSDTVLERRPTGLAVNGFGTPFSMQRFPTIPKADVWYAHDGLGTSALRGKLRRHRSFFGAVSDLSVDSVRPLRSGRRTQFSTAAAAHMLWMQDILATPTTPASTNAFWYSDTGTQVATITGLPAGTQVCSNTMDSSANPVFVYYNTGSAVLQWSKYAGPGTGILPLPTNSFTVGGNVSVVSPVYQNSGLARGVLVTEATSGLVKYYKFNGSTFVLTQTFTPSVGKRFNGAVAPDGQTELVLLEGGAAGGSSTDYKRYLLQASGTYGSLVSGSITPLRTQSAAHVFFYSAEPAANPTAQLLGTFTSPEWTLSTGVLTSVEKLSFLSPSTGLGSSSSQSLTPPGGATYLTGNQYRADTSVFALTAEPVTAAEPRVAISPSGGLTETAAGVVVQPEPIRFVVSPVGAGVQYQIDGGPLVTWDGNPVVLPSGTAPFSRRVTYFGTGPVERSRVHIADFAFAPAPPITIGSGVDSNQNGLADDWESYYGLTDPNGDPDGDGLNNLTEQNAGSDPLIRCGEPLTLSLQTIPGNQIRLILNRVLSTAEILEESAELDQWTPLSLPMGSTELVRPASGERRFWRVRLP